MIKSAYVRLVVASVVAIGLHGLLLVWIGDSSFTVATAMKSDSLQVALLPVQQKQSAEDKIPSIEPSSKPAIEKNQRKKSLQSEALSLPEPSLEYEASLEPEKAESAQIESREDALPSRQSFLSKEAALVPAEVQATILANVSYPRQARRRGWEGQAAFRFNINSQSIQSVTMLSSTGYPILDRAAHRGLLSIRSLPLTDGSYRLPVIFRLQ
ncbi:MAG: TonB family protein [Mariprofundaceae bacterium]